MKFFFENDLSFVDSIFMCLAAIGYSQGYIALPITITAIGLTVKYTIGRKYNAPAA